MKKENKKSKKEKEKGPSKKKTKPKPIPKSKKPPKKKRGFRIFGIKIELSRRIKYLILTGLVAAALVSLGVVTGDPGIMANVILLSTFIVVVPQFFLMYERYREIKEMEEKFPVFLRDVIESMSAGVPLHQAIMNNSKFDYGRLSTEVKKMAYQISWGMPLNKVLEQLSDRIKDSKRLFTSVKIINESYVSGGDVISILSTLTDHSNILEEAQKERRSLLNQYVVLMYAISIIFIVIVVAINRLMMPIFQVTSGNIEVGETMGIVNPCDPNICTGFDCDICKFYEATSSLIFQIDPTSIVSYYVAVFFFMSIIQAVFSGLVAGQIGENSIKAGVKHSLILISLTLGTFFFLIRFKILVA